MAKKNSDSKPISKGKFALNIALVVLQVLIVILAIAFSVSILLSTGYESNTDFGDSSIRLMPVLTDSMNGDKEDSFKAGDLIIVKSADKVKLSELKEGDIITYLDYVGEDLQFVTHRIVKINEIEDDNGKIIRTYTTMGDAETSGLTTTIAEGDIAGVYIGKLPGVGSAVFWLQDPTHFFLVIMLPLILLLLYNAFLVVRFVIDAKLKKQREQLAAAGATGETAVLDEEEIKRRAIEEYLSKMQADKAAEQTSESVKEEESLVKEPSDSAISDEAVAEEKKEEKAEESETGEKPLTEAESEKEGTAESDTSEEKKENADVAPVEEKAEEKTEEKEQDAPEAEAVEVIAEPAVQETEETAVKQEEPSPEKKETAKKTAAKKPAAKKTAAKADGAKTAAKKPAAKKTAATKTTSTAKTTAKTSAKTVEAKKTAKTGTAAKTAKKSAAKE